MGASRSENAGEACTECMNSSPSYLCPELSLRTMSPNVLYDRLCGKGRYGDALGQRNGDIMMSVIETMKILGKDFFTAGKEYMQIKLKK